MTGWQDHRMTAKYVSIQIWQIWDMIFIPKWNDHHHDDLQFQGIVGVVCLKPCKIYTKAFDSKNHLLDGFVNSLRECFPFRGAAATWKWFAGCEVCEFIEAGGIFSIQSFTLVRGGRGAYLVFVTGITSGACGKKFCNAHVRVKPKNGTF